MVIIVMPIIVGAVGTVSQKVAKLEFQERIEIVQITTITSKYS